MAAAAASSYPCPPTTTTSPRLSLIKMMPVLLLLKATCSTSKAGHTPQVEGRLPGEYVPRALAAGRTGLAMAASHPPPYFSTELKREGSCHSSHPASNGRENLTVSSRRGARRRLCLQTQTAGSERPWLASRDEISRRAPSRPLTGTPQTGPRHCHEAELWCSKSNRHA